MYKNNYLGSGLFAWAIALSISGLQKAISTALVDTSVSNFFLVQRVKKSDKAEGILLLPSVAPFVNAPSNKLSPYT